MKMAAAGSVGKMRKMLEFLMLAGKLKHIKRTGWVLREVPEPECIAGHMYRMAIMAMVLDRKEGVDVFKCMKLSLVHDMAESTVGDLTPWCGVSKEDKHKREKDAMGEIEKLVGGEIGHELYTLWEEYELETSEEAHIVKDLDKFDMILQAFEYEKQGQPHSLQEFFDSTSGKFTNSAVKEWVEELYKMRKEHQEQERTEKETVEKIEVN